MRIWPLMAALALLRVPALADEADFEVFFAQDVDIPVIAVPLDAKAGDTLWDSGPSRPVAVGFSSLLFQGQAEDSNFRFEASVLGPAGWGPWLAAEVRGFPNGRFWGRIPIAGAAGSVLRLRLVHQGCFAGRRIEIFSLELDPGERGERRSSPQASPRVRPAAFSAPAFSWPERPEIISRSQWKAADSKAPYELMTPRRITVHHTRAAQPRDRESPMAELRIIQQFHQNGRQWDDIAYHYLIDGKGRIYEGRPLYALGAHVKERNEDNVGIAVMGSFQKRNHHPTPEQLRALAKLSRYLSAAFGIPPEEFFGHRDLAPGIQCPGASLYRHLPEVRRALGRPPAPARAFAGAGLDLPEPGFRFD